MKKTVFAAIAAAMLLGAGAMMFTPSPGAAAESCKDLSGKSLVKCMDRRANAACADVKGLKKIARCRKNEKAKVQREIRKPAKAKKKTN